MATTAAYRYTAGELARSERATERKTLLAALSLVLLFSILTIWTNDRSAIAGTQIGVFSVALLAVFRCTILGRGWPGNWLQLPLFATAVWGLLQLEAQRSVYRYHTWSAILGWTTLAFAFVASVQLFDSESARRNFRMFAIYFGAILALWAILQLFSAEGKILWFYSTPSSRPMGPFLNYDHYSAFIELLLPMALWEASMDRRRAVLYGCLAAIMYASVIAGGSRAGSVLINLEVAAVLIPGLTRRGRVASRATGRVVLRIALLLLTFSAVVGWDVLLKRFEGNDPFAGRREDWQAGLAMLHDRPWLGFGLGAWTTAYPGYAVFDANAFVNAAHNDWLQWAGEGGIPFAILMLIIAARSVQLATGAPWGWGVAFVFLHSSVDFPLQKPPIFLWLVVVLATLEGERKKKRLLV